MLDPRLELVVFDMAGTTVRDDDAVNGCLRAALAAVGVPVSAGAVNAVMGLPKPQAIRRLLPPAAAHPDSAVESIHGDFVARMQEFYRRDPSVVPVDGALDVFRALRAAGLKVTLDTGFNRSIVDVILARLGWLGNELIDATITSDEVPRGRPYPDMILALMEKFGVRDAAAVAKVGDTPADLREGAAAGCGWNIGVTSGTHTRAELEPYPHTHLVDDIRALPKLFGL